MSRRKTGKLVAREVAVEKLGAPAREAMWGVFERYYAGIDRATFERDLATKQRVVLLSDSGDRSLQGFSTLEVYPREIDGRQVIAVFSGDTIIERDYWGQKALQTAFFFFILRIKLENPATPLYWFLISKGYKTYLLLSRNFVEYWPRHDRPTSPAADALMNALAGEKFGRLWDPAAGILRMEGRDGRLKQGVAPVDGEALSEPDIRFFVTKNPGYVAGDELVCLGLIDATFALAYAKKRALRALGVKPAKQAKQAKPALRRPWASETASS